MTEESKIEVPNFEATSDGKKDIYTETMARKIPAIRKKETQNGPYRTDTGSRDDTNRLVRKKTEIQENFIWGIGPEALYQMTRADIKTEPDKITVKDLIRLFNEYFLPKWNTYHNRGEFFWTRQTESETPEDFWQRLIEIEIECAFEGI